MVIVLAGCESTQESHAVLKSRLKGPYTPTSKGGIR